ncbi:MAG: hypothetical protein ACE5KV_00835 [Thermoplasmata archaeon]
MRRKGVPTIKYSSKGREEVRRSAKLGAALLIAGMIFLVLSGVSFSMWCFFSGFLLTTGGTFLCGVGAILLWRVPRIFWIIVSLCGGLLLATFLFGGFC